MHFSSSDVARVEDTWKQYVPSASLQRVDPTSFHFEWTSAPLNSVTLVRYDLAAQVQSVAQPEGQLLVCRVDAADGRVTSGRDSLDANDPWLTDGAQVRARWDRSAQVRALVIDQASAQARLRQITGHDGLLLRSSGLAPKDTNAARRWERMFSYLYDTLADATAADGILAAELERHALAVTFETFPTSVVEALAKPVQTRAAPSSVRRAVTFIEENAHLPITVDDIAAAAFISTRGLQYAFRRAMDVTPAEYLRQERLEGAHRELRGSADDSIAVIARRWGFSHPSRFAAAYRQRYGMAPSAAAARRRR